LVATLAFATLALAPDRATARYHNRERTVMEDKIKEVLETIRPALQADGGDVEFIDFNDGVVTVRLKGACGSCPMSMMTLKQGIEVRLKQQIPEVQTVEAL
jgi:Fe-S cluster biogenesis protein NfuA